MTHIRQKYRSKTIEFRHLWLSVEHIIGNAHLPLLAHAQDLSEFMSDIDSQSNPLNAVLLETYRQAKCTHLNAIIDPFIVMDILGECLYEQKNRYDVDVPLIDLIERIGLHISQKFISKLSQSSEVSQQTESKEIKSTIKTKNKFHKTSVIVFPFESFKKN